MQKIDTRLTDVFIIEPKRFGDHRGWFMETYSAEKLLALGIDTQFVQDNQSFSAQKGTLRGLHFQNAPKSQTKLVRCTGEQLSMSRLTFVAVLRNMVNGLPSS